MDKYEPIAIIGFGLKFPQQASTPSGFWDLLVQGASARTVTPADRYNADAFHRETVAGGRQRNGTVSQLIDAKKETKRKRSYRKNNIEIDQNQTWTLSCRVPGSL